METKKWRFEHSISEPVIKWTKDCSGFIAVQTILSGNQMVWLLDARDLQK
jgi:hypothetical protein